MISPAEFEKFLENASRRAATELHIPTLEVMTVAAEAAKALIGHENPEWAPLAERTIREKKALGYTGQLSATDPLLRTGEMRDSIKPAAELEPGGAAGAIGSDSLVAIDQEMGTRRIPPRPFLGLAMGRIEPVAKEVFGKFAVSLLVPRA